MKTKLDRLLESIDPIRTMEQVSARIDNAINSFRVERYIIKDWGQFRFVLIKFFTHTEGLALRNQSRHTNEPAMEWGRCAKLLLNKYGPNGDKTAFEMARTGIQGGLYAVLRSVAEEMISEYTGNEIKAKISQYWHSLSVDEKLAATDEYLTKYDHLLPSDLTEGSAAHIKANFTKVLEEHPRLINRMRSISC
jgi:hypothetical protein